MRTQQLVMILIILVVLLGPVQAMSNFTPSGQGQPSGKTLSEGSDFERVGTMEAIVTQIDPSGTVRNVITTLQNASYYGIEYVEDYQSIVESQLQNNNGAVAGAMLAIGSETSYLNGRIGGPTASLSLQINPILNIPLDASEAALLNLELSEVISIAEEMATQYEADLGIEFERFSITEQQSYFYARTPAGNFHKHGSQYQVQYLGLLEPVEAATLSNTMRDRLGSLGGFMDIIRASNWPTTKTHFAEGLVFDHTSDAFYRYASGMNPAYMQYALSTPFVRAHSSHASYESVIHTGVLGTTSFDAIEYVVDGSGNETYSLKQHVGHTGKIQTKMYQDNSINSISAILAATPSVLGAEGIPTEWDFVGKDFKFNSPYALFLAPNGEVIHGDEPIENLIRAWIIWVPRSNAMALDHSLSYVDPHMFDSAIDYLWGGAGPFPPYPDLKQEILETDWTYMVGLSGGYPLLELNQDMLRKSMERAGITPDSLLDHLNETLFEQNPAAGLVDAAIHMFDSYHLLDIFNSSVYSNPAVLVDTLNDFIGNASQLLNDFAGIDLPSSYKSKEALAELLEDHFGLVLQALWDAMASYVGSTTQIKSAVQAMLDPEHLNEETVPYLWVDMYAAVVEEYDYGVWLNFDMPVYGESPPNQLLWMSSDDIVLEFDMNIESVDYEGPHLIVRKEFATNQIAVEQDVTVTITVKNIGDATAYDIKLLDGIASGFDTDKQYYWRKSNLDVGETWTVTVDVFAEQVGEYAEIPTIACYFNQSLNSYNPSEHYWSGSARYTFSAIGKNLQVVGGGLLPTDVLGVPTTILIIVGAVSVVIVVVVIAKVRKP